MTNEELLKSISSMLKKHKDYLSENPDVFWGIQSRLLDAISYDEEETLEKARNSMYSDWKPKEKYADEHRDKITNLVAEGWSPREAERMVGAHTHSLKFEDALRSTIRPSEPSDKMLEHMREIATNYVKNAKRIAAEQADPALNPQKYAAHKHVSAHEDAYAKYKEDYANFLKHLDEQDLHPIEYDKAISEWEKKWHEENPGAKEQMIQAAGAGKHFEEANAARKEHIDDSIMQIVAGGGAPPASDDDSYQPNMDVKTAGQIVGAEENKDGTVDVNIQKDPAAIFQAQKPEFVEHLRQKMQEKLNQNPEMKARHDAMPERERSPAVIRRPAPTAAANQPAPVRTLSPEEIKAQYGDKYNISKPKGEQ